jgi:hypothetical protein
MDILRRWSSCVQGRKRAELAEATWYETEEVSWPRHGGEMIGAEGEELQGSKRATSAGYA